MPAGYWNPWHGCTKYSPGCLHCYVYRQDKRYSGSDLHSRDVRKNADFDLPIRRKRDKSYKLKSGQIVYTCMTSDFFVNQADTWREEAWKMIKIRQDLQFFIFTKRIDRFRETAPDDWGEGYDNVIIGCTVENQAVADYRLPIFNELPIKHKVIIIAPMLEKMDISRYLNADIQEVATSGESGEHARICDYDWILDIRRQCIENQVPFCFHQTGARFVKDGKLYRIPRYHQIRQARKANIDSNLQRNRNEEFRSKTSHYVQPKIKF